MAIRHGKKKIKKLRKEIEQADQDFLDCKISCLDHHIITMRKSWDISDTLEAYPSLVEYFNY